jgi:CheY-like chemotaxis protein
MTVAEEELESAPLILLVEDDPGIRDTLADCLVAERYRVTPARNGAEALEQVRGGLRPDLVLLDLVMPVMGGAEFLERLRADGAAGDVPVVLMTAAARGFGEEIPAVGAVLAKPFDLDALLDLVARHVRRT